MRTARPAAWLVLPALLAAAGCGDGTPKRYGVTGTVRIAGKPVVYGAVRFFPESGSGTESGAPIEGGAFAIPAAVGLPAGVYKVTLTAPDRVIEGGGAPGSDAGPAPKELFPDDVTDVTKTPLRLEVKAGGPNTFAHDSPARK